MGHLPFKPSPEGRHASVSLAAGSRLALDSTQLDLRTRIRPGNCSISCHGGEALNDTPTSTKIKLFALELLAWAVGWTGLALSAQNKWIGAALAWGLAFVWTVIVGVVSKIWSRAEKTLVDLAGEWVEIQIRDLFSGYSKRYLDHTRNRYGTFDAKGLVTQGPFSLGSR